LFVNAKFYLILVLIFAGSLNAQSLFSIEQNIPFADHLFSEGDYLRASIEYRNIIKSRGGDTIMFKLAESYWRIGRFEEAANNFKTLFFSGSLADQSKLMYFRSLFGGKNFQFIIDNAENELYSTPKYSGELSRLKTAAFFLTNQSIIDTAELFASFEDSVKTRLGFFYRTLKNPPSKNPTTASILSALVPGAGKIYTGEVSDGITSFLVNGLLIYLAADNFKADHKFRGWLFTGLAALFYSGNIYGSAASAQIYNARVRFNLDSELKLFFESNNYFQPKIGFSER
jgi:TM2 domain-containing membrane protein YozV